MLSLQPFVIGVVLVGAAAVKLASRHAPAAARRSALPRLVGERLSLPAYRTVGAVELLLGACLLLPPALPAEAFAAAGLGCAFLFFLIYARLTVPESSCGCLGSQPIPLGVRSFARTITLTLAALASAFSSPIAWHTTVSAQPVFAVAVVAAELGLFVALSSELDAHWLLPLRRLQARFRRPTPAGPFVVPLASTVEQLHHSDAYQRLGAILRSDVREHWDDGDWRIVCYSARYEGRPVSAVFAVPRLRYEPAAVRAALVDERYNTVLTGDPRSVESV